ncbi:MAG: 3-dehydroquinate synthase family protein, partial [Rhabdochlamydiaceae bacterium]
HKNRLGSYFAPLATFLDKTFLRSLDQRQVSNGLAEILKMAMIKDSELFELLEQHGRELLKKKFQEDYISGQVIRKAVHGMLEELEANLWEHNLYRIVDFGHTFSPSVEMQALPALLHGEAVTLDMALSVMLAYGRDLLSSSERDRFLSVMQLLNLPITHPLCEAEFLYESLQDTVKHRDGLQRIPLPSSIGEARFFNDITFEEIRKAIYALRLWEAGKKLVAVA